MNLEQIKAELRLFKAYTDDTKLSGVGIVNQDALKSGLLIVDICSDEVLASAVELYGIKPEEWNQTFHKSFQTVIDTPIEVLVAQQLIHYFTTYGLEDLGLYNEELVYIPKEKLDIPELAGDIKLIPINKITERDLGDRILSLLSSGVALSKQTVEDIMLLSDYIDKEKFDEIKNKEIKIALYDKYNIVPKNNMDFLRYLVYKLTDSTMLIKSNDMIRVLSNCDKEKALKLLKSYVGKPYGYKKLGEIFLSENELFVAIKAHNVENEVHKELNHIINRIRREANKSRKKIGYDVLDRLTSIYGYDKVSGDFIYNPWFKKDVAEATLTQVKLNQGELIKKLDDVTIFREIRILNAIAYRLNKFGAYDKFNDDAEYLGNYKSILYKIRNGKSYADEFVFEKSLSKITAQQQVYDLVEKHLVDRLNKILKDKYVYIPDGIDYKAPTSEKQFIGNIPVGTTIVLPRNNNMVIGVHWKNLDEERVDLDLHAIGSDVHVGWNASYRETNIVHSGDVTDAQLPNGATECLLVRPNLKETTFVVKLKNFTHNRLDVPYEFIIASTTDDSISKNYTINPNDVLVSINTKFDYDSKYNDRPDIDIAYVTITEDNIKLAFVNTSTDNSIAGFRTDVRDMVVRYAEAYPSTQLSLRDIINMADCKLSDKPIISDLEEVKILNDKGEEEILYKKVEKKVDFDLSLQNITKDTILSMFMEA